MADLMIIHVHPYGNLWKIQIAGMRVEHSVHESRSEAVEAAIKLAHQHRSSQVVLHRDDGSIESTRDYDVSDPSADT